MKGKKMNRCNWVGEKELMIKYHDEEWGVPVYDDRKLFEFLVLDAFQAGLSWEIVLRKRENFRLAFDDYDVRKIAKYNQAKFDCLIQDQGIIRNRMKIEATINNAKRFMEVQKEFGSFDKYIRQFTDGKTIQNRWRELHEIPAKTDESIMMSKDLKKRGFKFVGPTICYAFMQAAGMVNDHLVSCFRYKELISSTQQ